MLTAGEAQEHITNTLAGSLAPELSPIDLVNYAGRHLCSGHSWRWLDRRVAVLGLNQNDLFTLLPPDVGTIRFLIYQNNPYRRICIGSLQEVLYSRGSPSTPPQVGTVYLAALAYRQLPPPNLLQYSEALSNSPWTSVGTITVTPNGGLNPNTGETTADLVGDTDGVVTSSITQEVPSRLLNDGEVYTYMVQLAPEPITGANPPKASISIGSPEPGTNGKITQLEIQWGAVPWSDTPTATIIGTNTGEAVSLDPVAVGDGVWQFALSGYAYEKAVNYGRIICTIEPARAAFADPSGTDDPSVTGTVRVVRTQLNQGYESVAYKAQTDEIRIPKRRQPVLELDRASASSEPEALQLIYRGQWVDAEDDEDELHLPEAGWCDALYLQFLRALARGWEEEGLGTLDERWEHVKRGPLFMAATEQDGLIQESLGEYKWGSASRMSRRFVPRGVWETNFNSYSGPT